MNKPIDTFYKLISIAILLKVLDDIVSGIWFVHTGEYFRRVVFLAVPLFPAWAIAIVWIVLGLSAVAVFFDFRRIWALRISAFGMAVNLSQTYQNQKFFLFLVLVYLSISLINNRSHLVARLARYQLIIIYMFSAIHKVLESFYDGNTLSNTLNQVLNMPSGSIAPNFLVEFVARADVSPVVSSIALIFEFLIPVLLMRFPKIGFFSVVIFHVGLSVLMPGLWPFTMAMVAVAYLFLL